METIKKQIKNAINTITKDNYIKKWIDNKTKDLLVENDDIIECIANCTSPVKIEDEDKDIQEKIKTIFNAFTLFPISETQILILGQDPYPDDDEYRVNHYGRRAHGLAFSFANSKGIHEPADDSLLNIFKAIKVYKDDMKQYFCDIEDNKVNWETNLKNWAKNNGILLLNTALTHEKNDKEVITKHQNAWKPFVQQIICNLLNSKINNQDKKLAVFLWGVNAQNIFFESLNDIYKDDNNFWDNVKSMNLQDIKYKKVNKFKKVNFLKHGSLYLNNIINMYLTSHPSNNRKAVYKGFCYEAPNHFKACDEFLGKDIWKNFPDNNKKQ